MNAADPRCICPATQGLFPAQPVDFALRTLQTVVQNDGFRRFPAWNPMFDASIPTFMENMRNGDTCELVANLQAALRIRKRGTKDLQGKD